MKEEKEQEERCHKCGSELEEYPNGQECTNKECDYKYIYNF